MSRPRRAVNTEEDGFAMIIAVIVATVSILVATLILTTGVQLNTSTVRERNWQLAFQVAESGIENAVTQLRTTSTYGGTTGTPESVAGGEFEVRVQDKGSGKLINAVGYVPSKTATNSVKRRLTVEYQPEPSFRYALFSGTSLFVNSGNGAVQGDVFANQDVVIDNTSEVFGSVISGAGKVALSNGAKVRKAAGEGGDVTSGGYDTTSRAAVEMDANSVIEGDVRIRVGTVCTTTAAGGQQAYNLVNGGTIGGSVRMPNGPTASNPGAIAGQRVAECLATEGQKPLPSYTFNPSNYPGLLFRSTTWFNAGGPPLTGAYYIQDDGTGPINLSNRQAGGTLALISEPKITQSNTGADFFPATGLGNATIQIIALNTSTDPLSPSFEVQNHFDVPTGVNSPAVLVYSRGFCNFKNTAIENGAVYCNGMDIKNGLTVTYDSRIERLLGFGAAKLVRASFFEPSSNTPLP